MSLSATHDEKKQRLRTIVRGLTRAQMEAVLFMAIEGADLDYAIKWVSGEPVTVIIPVSMLPFPRG